MAQPVNSDTQLIPLKTSIIKSSKTSAETSYETSAETSYETSTETSAENSAETSSETFIDPRPRTIIFTSNPQINASIEDRLTSYDQTEIFKYRPVDIIIIGAFNRTQIQNQPLYLNALLIQSHGIDAKTVSNVLKKGL